MSLKIKKIFFFFRLERIKGKYVRKFYLKKKIITVTFRFVIRRRDWGGTGEGGTQTRDIYALKKGTGKPDFSNCLTRISLIKFNITVRKKNQINLRDSMRA